jgi:hypothetical protein
MKDLSRMTPQKQHISSNNRALQGKAVAVTQSKPVNRNMLVNVRLSVKNRFILIYTRCKSVN